MSCPQGLDGCECQRPLFGCNCDCTLPMPHFGPCVGTSTTAPKNSQDFEEPLVMLTDDEMAFESDAKRVYDDALALLLKKHSDYGPKNIGESPGGALNGLRVRIWDKIARLNNLIDSGAEPENESLRDSFVDLLNYSAIALLVLDGKWPE